MDKKVILNKSDFDGFIAQLTKIQKVAAPVSKGYNSYAFQEVKTADEISLEYIPTILPPKKYFMPQKENIQKFNKEKNTWTPIVETEKLILFGVHTCDLAGINCLNIVFKSDPVDVNYLARKDEIIIIALECNKYCDEYASCAVMGNHLPSGGYDLLFTDLGDYFLVDVGTDEGIDIVSVIDSFKDANGSHLKDLENLRARKREIFKPEFNVGLEELKPLFAKSFKNKVWEDLGNRCVSCGNCTNVCPTCYCFDIKDDINLDFNTGFRFRTWDSCQNEPFAKVAGEENFREKRSDRQKHRYMRKFNYPVDKFSHYFCTGCGRCSRTCMAKINMKETINQLSV
ncbi:4Fe-4S dicluster domain-containing protein [bacterium]|nr:4Fe-4S dicluster domain-containing protein [bacterium]